MAGLTRYVIGLATAVAVLLAVSLAAILLVRERPQPVAAGPHSQPQQAALPLKVVISREGLTAIDADSLRAAGVDPAAIPDEQWQLRKGDHPVALWPTGTGGDFRLLFYGEASDNPYSRERVYWLELAPEGGMRPDRRTMQPPVSEGSTTVSSTLRVDWHDTYHSRLTVGEDRWLGPSLIANRDLTLPVTVPSAAPGPAHLRLHLWANTASPEANPDHHVVVSLNGQQVAEGRHEGQGFWEIQATLPEGLLRAGDNELLLQAPGDTGARVQQDFPDRLQLTYPMQLEAQDGMLTFGAPPGPYRISGFPASRPLVSWDVSDPQAPVRLEMDSPIAAAADGSLSFADTLEGTVSRTYAIGTVDELPAPLQLVKAWPVDIRQEDPAEYIIMGPETLLESLRPLVQWREGQGLTVATLAVEAIYDQFGQGRRGPEAIQSFLRWAVSTWSSPPRFVLLVGDSSYDPLGYGGSGEADVLPTCLVDTYFVGETASDYCYADLDDDLSPELAVGRLPARTPDQLATIVEKIVAYEQIPTDSAWLQRALLVADAEPEFPAASQRIADEALLPASFDLETLYLNDPTLAVADAARDRLFSLLDQGVGLVSYIGHGSPRWWAGELLSSQDAAELDNKGHWPIFTALTCLNGFFHHPTAESLSEALLWAEGGAVAAFMPSSEGVTSQQLPIAIAFYQHLLNGASPTLGEAIVAAKRDLVAEGSTTEDMIRTFNLLGDPALRLPVLANTGP